MKKKREQSALQQSSKMAVACTVHVRTHGDTVPRGTRQSSGRAACGQVAADSSQTVAPRVLRSAAHRELLAIGSAARTQEVPAFGSVGELQSARGDGLNAYDHDCTSSAVCLRPRRRGVSWNWILLVPGGE